MPHTPFLAALRAAAGRGPLFLAAFGLASAAPVRAAGEITAIFSQTSPGYARVKGPGGSFLPETYTLGDGGCLPGAAPDPSIDRLNFIDLAKLVTGPLEAQNYRPVPDRDPNKTKLLVMVYWGTTRGAAGAMGSAATQALQDGNQALAGPPPPPPAPTAGGPMGHTADPSVVLQGARQNSVTTALATVALEDRQREEATLRNAQLLGYDSELGPSAGGFGASERRRADLIAELEDDRYFIVLMAYDFDGLWKHRRHKLLWLTRFSVRARGTNFAAVAAAMVQQASSYFGRSSGGLLRDALPEGRVDIGAVKSLGEVPTH